MTHFSVPGLNEPRHREGILRASKNCLIHNTLVHAPSIVIELAECPGQAEEQRQALAEARQAEGFETKRLLACIWIVERSQNHE